MVHLSNRCLHLKRRQTRGTRKEIDLSLGTPAKKSPILLGLRAPEMLAQPAYH